MRLIFRSRFFLAGALREIGGAACQLAALRELAAICRRFGLQKQKLIPDSWFPGRTGDLLLHSRRAVLEEIYDVQNQRYPRRVDAVSARLPNCGYGLIELVDPLIGVSQ